MSSNIRVVNNKIPDILRNLDNLTGDALYAAASEGEQIAKLLFNTGSAGRTYGQHIASAPGGPPNVDTGAYRASITAERRSNSEAAFGTDLDYPVYLEYGTVKMGPRPLFAPAAVELGRRIPSIFNNFLGPSI